MHGKTVYFRFIWEALHSQGQYSVVRTLFLMSPGVLESCGRPFGQRFNHIGLFLFKRKDPLYIMFPPHVAPWVDFCWL